MDNPNRPSPLSPPSCPPAGESPLLLHKGEHPISRRNIDPDVFKIISRLNFHGFTAYLVGGAVRDMMLGRTPADFDLVTDARPGQIKKLFSNCYLIGRRFRLAHVHFRGGKYIEVATFRKESQPVLEPEPMPVAGEPKPPAQTPAGCPAAETSVPPAFHDIYGTPREDAFRRDLTINALFFDLVSSTVIDYVGGLQDLRNRIVRVIGDPAERFVEDPVRIWRTIRHAARIGFEIEGATEQMIPVFSHLIAKCPGARLYEELNNDLESRTQPIFAALRRHSILRHILGRMGEAFETDGDLYARVDRLLEIKDRTLAAGLGLGADEAYALFFLPWAERQLAGGSEGDLDKLLKDAIMDARFQASVPRTLRANVIQILMIVEQMLPALRTGRMRWALKRRAHFDQASRVCIMSEKGRPPDPGETFEDLYRQAFPAGSAPLREGHRRRRRRRRRPPAAAPSGQ